MSTTAVGVCDVKDWLIAAESTTKHDGKQQVNLQLVGGSRSKVVQAAKLFKGCRTILVSESANASWLAGALAEAMPSTVVFERSHDQCVDVCGKVLGRPIEYETVEKVTGGCMLSRCLCRKHGTNLYNALQKLQVQVMIKEAAALLQDTSKILNSAEAHAQYRAITAQPGLDAVLAVTIWTALGGAPQPACQQKAAGSTKEEEFGRFRDYEYQRMQQRTAERKKQSAEFQKDATRLFEEREKELKAQQAALAQYKQQWQDRHAQQDTHQQQDRPQQQGTGAATDSAAAAAAGKAAAQRARLAELSSPVPSLDAMPLTKMQRFIWKQVGSTSVILRNCSSSAKEQMFEVERLFKCRAEMEACSQQDESQEERASCARAVLRLGDAGAGSSVTARKAAYKQLALLVHPDRVPAELQDVCCLFTTAYNVLQAANDLLS